MTALRLVAAGLCLGLAAAPLADAAPAKSAPAKTSATKPAAAKPAAAKPATPAAPIVDPAAVKALGDMSRFLQSLNSFQLKTQTSLDLVARDGQKIQFEGTADYRVRKPAAFVIDVVSDEWSRRYIYDGREFTLYAPKLGYFSTWPAPATSKETIALAESKFGISIPLDDLFRWGEPDGLRAESLQSGFKVGIETIEGVKTTHYAFREGEIDWQIWIQLEGQPLPRKVVIVNRRDPAGPAYVARLNWTLNPTLTDADFAFRPPQDAMRIRTVLHPEGVTP